MNCIAYAPHNTPTKRKMQGKLLNSTLYEQFNTLVTVSLSFRGSEDELK